MPSATSKHSIGWTENAACKFVMKSEGIFAWGWNKKLPGIILCLREVSMRRYSNHIIWKIICQQPQQKKYRLFLFLKLYAHMNMQKMKNS